ncbi:MAG: glycoside hydrolase family protein, partial [Anaerolineae bacterium]|nr:glycoside hydrolase family protein [Anaerolineae bacterium]
VIGAVFVFKQPTQSLPASQTASLVASSPSAEPITRVTLAPGVQPGPHCRFGITAPYSITGYDLEALGVGALLDWSAQPPADLPAQIEFIRVLRLRDDLFPQMLAGLSQLVAQSPGAFWEVGNEPDTSYEDQDNLPAEVFAQRYYQVALQIRTLDPSAKIGFGAVVQPTPLRLRYLQRAWDELLSLAGSRAAASALIDFWNVHAFILNETPDGWGTGVPPGFSADFADAVIIDSSPYLETHSNPLFERRVIDFRQWMASIGEQDKELWITEYGSLFPPLDPPAGRDLINVSDEETTRFMLASFDFLLTAVDPALGMPGDGGRLVQRWFWYSLNDYRHHFGGSLYDPDQNKAITPVGRAFAGYLASLPLDLEYCP